MRQSFGQFGCRQDFAAARRFFVFFGDITMATLSAKLVALFVIFGRKLGRPLSSAASMSVLLFGLIGACGKAGSTIVGSWVRTDGSTTCTTTFDPDGRFSGRCLDQKTTPWTFSGVWSIDGSKLTYEYQESSLKQIPAGTKDDTLVAIANDHYVVEGRDGVRRDYRRQ